MNLRGRGDLVVRSQFRDWRIPDLKPDAIQDPPFGSVPARAARPAAHSPSKLKGERVVFSLRIFCAVNELWRGRVLCSSDLLLSYLLIHFLYSFPFLLLFFRFRESWYSESEKVYTPTGFERYTATYCVGGYRIHFTLWDTSGTSAYDTVRPLSYKDASVFLLCFTIGSPDSLDNTVNKVKSIEMCYYLCIVLTVPHYAVTFR
ncbi:hypothetical protein AVEN_60978-1 [Araneus ventricosus]|uniref:Uncharacterized protein n=1 Tax=Araneus ventricosus TaxID=182803 RepID=A0A4Y2DBG9_ARAVE|nr:hypothetical protein AVEN_60978-1 [Araneus ventricosus]